MKIGVVTTGGTIAGSVIDNVIASQATGDAEAADLVDTLVSKTELLFRSPLSVMSENMEPENWTTIANAVRELAEYDEVTGVLVLHGTDTVTFTCAALSFMCADLKIPVVVTGSNVPAGELQSDALNNMKGAITTLTNLERGCYLSFAGTPSAESMVFSGTRVRKLHAGGQPYRSVGAPVVAKVEPNGTFNWNSNDAQLIEPHDRATPTHTTIDRHVAMWNLYPGFDFQGLEYLTKERDYRCIVIQLYGSLSAPTDTAQFDTAKFVDWCRGRGITVIGCPHEPPVGNLLDYESTVSLRQAGMVIAPHALPEVAYVKACWLGALGLERDDFISSFQNAVAAEFYSQDQVVELTF
jgi:L-asparaginase/Glu-tRNA(Gln) amidotransferase subunit D